MCRATKAPFVFLNLLIIPFFFLHKLWRGDFLKREKENTESHHSVLCFHKVGLGGGRCMVLLIYKPHLFLRQKWVKFLAPFLPVEVWMNQPLFAWVTLPDRLLCWLFLPSAVDVPAWFQQTPSSIHLSSVWVFFQLSPPQGSGALASWWPPPLAALVLSFIHVVSSGGVEVSQTKSPSSRKWKLQIKQRRFAYLLSQLLPGPSERKLGKGGRQASVEGCWNPSREASAFVCFVIAYLSGCLLGLVKVKICLFPFFLFLLKPFTQMEMNRVLTLFTGIGVNGYLNDLMRSHWTLAVYCVSNAGFPLTNEQMNIHMTWKVSRSLGDSLAF